jgi:hypothetical protein
MLCCALVIMLSKVILVMQSSLWKRIMGDYGWLLILVGWFVLMKFVLPRLGVST